MSSAMENPEGLPAEAGRAGDVLLQALLFLAAHFGRGVAGAQLIAGLPLAEGRLDHAHLAEAAGRAGLALSLCDRDVAKIKSSMLPALVLGEGGDALVVLHRRGDQFECVTPGVAGSVWIERAALQAEHAGPWYFVRPVFHFDVRSLLYHLPQPRRWFWDTLLANRAIYGWALLGTVVVNLLGALIPFYTMAVYDRVVPNSALDSLWVLTGAAVVVVLFDLILKTLRSHLLDSAGRKADLALSSRVFSQSLRLRATSRPASGGVLANIVRDFESVRDFFTSTTLTLLGDMPFTLLYLALVAIIGGALVLVPIAIMVLALTAAWLLQKPLMRIMSNNMQDSAQRTAHLFEVMNGLDTVKALGGEAWARRKWEMLCVRIAEESLKMREVSSFGGYLSATLVNLENVILVMWGAIMITENNLTMGQLIACSMLASRAIGPTSQLSGLILRWQQTKLSLTALDQIMAAPTDDAAGSMQLPRLVGQVEFREVSFAYPQCPHSLKDFNLSIKPGEKVGFIGRLGSGKSTALKLLINMHLPLEGQVLVDGVAVQQIDPYNLRRQIGYVPQELTLFHGSIRDNILMGSGELGDEAILEAARLSCLDEVLAQLPNGLETQVGERGDRLSGGQRQAVAIARALVRKPGLLIMDEPSSQMDPSAEQRLITNLRASLKESTLILVTHRTAMLPLIDRLVVVDRGRVLFDGPRDQVLQQLRGPAPQVQQ